MDSRQSPLNSLLATAREAERSGNLEIAASAWKEIRLQYPESSEGFTFGGCLLKRLGQLSEALSVFGQGLDRFPKNEWLAVEQAWAFIDLGDFATAAQRWRDIRRCFPNNLGGYLGGGLLFALNVAMVSKPAMFGLADVSEAVRWSFVSVGIWWAGFTLFTVLLVKERSTHEPLPAKAAIRAGAAELLNTLRHIRGDRTLLWFLLAYWFYIDGVNTIIKMAVDYGLSLGLKQNTLITALLLVQFIGFPAALAFGWLGQKIGPRAGILLGIAVYGGIAFYAYFLQTERQFMVMALIIGLVQGGVQSLSRSLFGRLVPPGKAGEFFGFYNLMGKAAAILGPTLTGVVALTTHDSRLAILSITILFVIGAAFLMRVRLPSDG